MNQWHHLVSDLEGAGEIHIHQDLNLFALEIEVGEFLVFDWNLIVRHTCCVLKEHWG